MFYDGGLRGAEKVVSDSPGTAYQADAVKINYENPNKFRKSNCKLKKWLRRGEGRHLGFLARALDKM